MKLKIVAALQPLLLCRVQYIGESEQSLKKRFSEQRGYVTNKQLTKATGQHFKIPALEIEHVT